MERPVGIKCHNKGEWIILMHFLEQKGYVWTYNKLLPTEVPFVNRENTVILNTNKLLVRDNSENFIGIILNAKTFVDIYINKNIADLDKARKII